jgi:DNA-binding MarR family transcriptional regulator
MRATPTQRRERRVRNVGSRPTSLSELVFALSRAYYAYSGRLEIVLAELELDEHVRPGMGHVLFALFEEDDVIIKNLVARTRLAPSSLGRLVLQMEQRGLIVRRKCDLDGRAVRVQLTSLARSLEGRCREALKRLKKTVEAGFEPHELEAARKALEQMIDNLRQA